MLADMSWLTRLGFVADAQGRRADEAALLARVLRGDAQALALLYRRESGPVYRYALALVADEAAALDAMQEAFTQLLLNPQGFEPGRGTLGAYLAGIARHQLLARWRDAKRFVALIDEVDDEAVDEQTRADAAGTELSAEQRLVDAQRSEQLWSAVRRLAWSQREALVLVDLQERSYEEAAAVAGTRVDVLRSRLHRARARLAALLAAPQGEPQP